MIFREALLHVLSVEGGYVFNPNDPGGATNKGITQRTYDAWRRAQGKASVPVRDISDAEVAAIYESEYWVPAKCAALPAGIRLAHFDCAVNCGVTTAARLLQEAAGLGVDGKIGPLTIAGVGAMDSRVLLEQYLWLRARYYARITEKNHRLREFLSGWIFRLISVRRAS